MVIDGDLWWPTHFERSIQQVYDWIVTRQTHLYSAKFRQASDLLLTCTHIFLFCTCEYEYGKLQEHNIVIISNYV